MSVYIAGFTAGILAYVVGRAMLGLRDTHREALAAERCDNVVRLIQPYSPTIEIDLRGEISSPQLMKEQEQRAHLRAV